MIRKAVLCIIGSFILTANVSLANAEVLRIGKDECSMTDQSSMDSVAPSDLLLLFEQLEPEVSTVEIRCVHFDELLEITLRRPNISLKIRNTVFYNGLEVSGSTLQEIDIDGSQVRGGRLRILRNSLTHISVSNSTISAPIQIGKNTVSGGLLIGQHIFFNDFNPSNTVIAGELAIYQNHLVGFIELGGLSISDEKNMPFIYGNHAQSLMIRSIDVTCCNDENEDEFSITRNNISDQILIAQSSIAGTLRVAGRPLNSLEIRDSQVSKFFLFGQEVRDFYIRDRDEMDSTNIGRIDLAESVIGYLNISTVKSDSIRCQGCVVQHRAGITGTVKKLDLQNAEIQGQLEIGDATIGKNLVQSSFETLDFRNLSARLLRIDNSIERHNVDVLWGANRILGLNFSNHVKSPDELAKKLYDQNTDANFLTLIAGYFESNGSSELARKVRYKIKSQQVWDAGGPWIWRFSIWLLGSLTGFGYYYQNLVAIVVSLIVIGGFMYSYYPHASKCGGKYFDGIAYTTNQIIPGIMLDRKYEFSFNDKVARVYFYTVKLFGYVAIALILADIGSAA